MREINQLIYTMIKSDSSFQLLTGATATDPRIYRSRTPAKLNVSTSKPGYAVYRLMGTSKPGNWTHGGQRNDMAYGLEAYCKKDTTLDEICDRIWTLFEDQSLSTTSYLVKHTYATRGSQNWDDGRVLYYEVMMLHMTHIYIR